MTWRFQQGFLPRSLVGRVFALYTVTLLALVSAGLGLFYRYQFGVELEEAQLRGDTLSAVMVPAVSDSAVIGDYDTIRRTLERALFHSSFASASFIDLQGGVVLAPRRPETFANLPPHWMVDRVAAQLYDINQTISVGGHDYGVLRLSFAPEQVAGRLWAQTRIALELALVGFLGGVLLIRWPLVRWLGNLQQIQAFDRAIQTGEAAPDLPKFEGAPLEFRETFEVLGRAAASLQAQRAQAATTLASIADAVFTLDAAGQILLANPAASELTGLGVDELIGQELSRVLPEVLEGHAGRSHWNSRRTAVKGQHGAALVLETTLSAILGPDGQKVGQVLACRDVTEQHDLEKRLRAELAARESALVSLRRVLEGLMEDRDTAEGMDDLGAISLMISDLVLRLRVRSGQLDAIFALSPDGFVSFDADHRVNYVSPAFGRLTGRAESAVLGMCEEDVERLIRGACGSNTPWGGFEQMRRDPSFARPDVQGKRELIGIARPVKRVLEVGLRLGPTESISQVLSLRDVTHESEVDQIKSEFLSTAAHELRTPMTSVYGFAELMLRREMPPAQQREIFATIHRQAGLMINIINELLDLSRIEARRGKDFELESLDLRDLTTALVHDFKPPQDRPLPDLALGSMPAVVRVDRHKLAQAIGNVLSNAYKYSPVGGRVSLRLIAASVTESTLVGLEVRDHGIGMSPEHLARVGERFFRADASGRIPGTGLGLSIVKEIIELLGGSLDVQSRLHEGTAVTLWLPGASAVVQSDPRLGYT